MMHSEFGVHWIELEFHDITKVDIVES